jgi:hypothetical protein
MNQQKIRELYRDLQNTPSPESKYAASSAVVTIITDSGFSLPEKAKEKVDRGRGFLSYGYSELNANSENMKTTIEDLKEVLRTIYSMVEHGTTGDEMADETELTGVEDFFSNLWRRGGMRRKSQTARFCRCIKSVRKTLKARKGSTKEQGAIAVCVKSVLHRKGKTVKKFTCGKKMRLVTQKRK